MEDFKFINVGKFFAMFCVVMMHSIRDNYNLIFKIVQIGCMAYFFFASGFLFKGDEEKSSVWKYVIKNVKNLLLPYFVCAALGVLSVYVWPDWYPNVTTDYILESIFITCAPIGFTLVWFLVVLFTIKIVFFILWKAISILKNKILLMTLLVACIIVLNFVAQYLIRYYQLGNPRINWKLDCAVVAMMFYIIGFICKCLKVYKIFIFKWVSLILFVIARIVCGYIEVNMIAGRTNIFDFAFGNDFNIYFINQIIGILSFLALGSVCRDIKLLNYLGRHNLYVYLSHSYVLWGVEEMYGKIIGETKYSFYELREILLISVITYIISIFVSEMLKKMTNVLKVSNNRQNS